ncbi:hypothetical protein GCM10020256_28170 [Streptomyces thermocoprophilus]
MRGGRARRRAGRAAAAGRRPYAEAGAEGDRPGERRRDDIPPLPDLFFAGARRLCWLTAPTYDPLGVECVHPTLSNSPVRVKFGHLSDTS